MYAAGSGWRILDGSSGIITSYKDEYAVGQDNVIGLNNPGNPDGVADALTDLLRSGARQMLAAAVEAEMQEFVKRRSCLPTSFGSNSPLRSRGMPIRSGPSLVRTVFPLLPLRWLLAPSAHHHSLHEAEKSTKMHSATNPRLVPRFTRFLTPAYILMHAF